MNLPQTPGKSWLLHQLSHRVTLLSLACLLVLTMAALGQGVSRRLESTVQDATGALIPGAKISVSNQDTGVVAKYTSGSHGEYIANLLPPGNYKVEASADGFSTTASTGNLVTVDGVTRVDMMLQLGAATQSVEVTGAIPCWIPRTRPWVRY